MSDEKSPTRSLTPARVALVVIGLFFIFGIYPQAQIWPSAWKWGHASSHYPAMLLGIYATLGVFLLIAARDPLAHRSLIWFTVVSSVVHGGIMAAEALGDPAERGHFMGDVPAFLTVAVVLSLVMPRASMTNRSRTPR